MTKDNKYACIIIDDEPLAIKVILEHLDKIKNIQCIKTFTNAIDAMEILNIENIDILFLDINMPGISGVEFLKTLNNKPKVIFTTAYRNFAVDAFELDALDYLVKPISFERFLKSVNKCMAALENKKTHKIIDEDNEDKNYIILKSDKKNYKIKHEDILYIESLDNYIKVITKTNSIICYEKLSGILEKLPIHNFLRIHRSYIININKITVFTTSFVEINQKKFTIGRNYKEEVLKKLF